MEPIPKLPISYCSPPSSLAPAFHYLHFPSSPSRSGRNPFSSPPSSTVLLPPLSHHLSRTSLPPSPLPIVASQIWTEPIPEPLISCCSPPSSPAPAFHHLRFSSLPPRSERKLFLSPSSPVILLPPLPHHLSRIDLSPSLPRRRRFPDLDGTHSQAPHLLSFPSLLSHTTSPTPAFHHLRFPLSPPRSGQNPFPSPPSPAVLLPPLLHQPFTISARSLDATGIEDWEQGISIEPIALFSSLLSRTILSRSPLAVVYTAGMGDQERERQISIEPIALFSSFLSHTSLSPS